MAKIMYLLWKIMNHKPSKKRLQEGDVIRMLFKYFVGNNSQSKRHFMEDIPFSRRVKSKQKQNKTKSQKQNKTLENTLIVLLKW